MGEWLQQQVKWVWVWVGFTIAEMNMGTIWVWVYTVPRHSKRPLTPHYRYLRVQPHLSLVTLAHAFVRLL
eukprot:14715-Heterococcus_DN1.PRE.5